MMRMSLFAGILGKRKITSRITMVSSCRPLNPSGSVPAQFLREKLLIILLASFLISGVFFMLIPGTLLGVLNLIQIGSQHNARAVALAWIQAHGHAQLFGWIGTFILGIGFYSIPNLRKLCSFNFVEGWLCLLFWTAGVGLRWFTVTSGFEWRFLLPLSSILEFAVVAYFVYLSFKGTRLAASGKKLETWSVSLIAGSMVWLILMFANVLITFDLLSSSAPLLPAVVGRKFLFASVWAFIIPIVWGLSARWLPSLLRLKTQNQSLLKTSVLFNLLASLAYVLGIPVIPESILLVSSCLFVSGMNLLAMPEKKEKSESNYFPSFPIFVRVAYGWLIVSSVLFLASALYPDALGTAGAARHAITVGFLSGMVFSVGPRVLPAFLGRKKGFCPPAVMVALTLLSVGCFLRVSSQILSYDFSVSAFWSVLPVSALIELLAMTIFFFNILFSLREKPAIEEIVRAYSRG